jgi:hypothetical protein
VEFAAALGACVVARPVFLYTFLQHPTNPRPIFALRLDRGSATAIPRTHLLQVPDEIFDLSFAADDAASAGSAARTFLFVGFTSRPTPVLFQRAFSKRSLVTPSVSARLRAKNFCSQVFLLQQTVQTTIP